MTSLHMNPALRRRNILALITSVSLLSQLGVGVGAVTYRHGRMSQLNPALRWRNILALIHIYVSQLGVGSGLLSLVRYMLKYKRYLTSNFLTKYRFHNLIPWPWSRVSCKHRLVPTPYADIISLGNACKILTVMFGYLWHHGMLSYGDLVVRKPWPTAFTSANQHIVVHVALKSMHSKTATSAYISVKCKM